MIHSPPAQHAPAQPSEPLRALVRQLGAPTWQAREQATQELVRRGDLSWLPWAQQSHDAEIRMRAEAIRLRVSRCGCANDGHPHCLDYQHDTRTGYCGRCGCTWWFHCGAAKTMEEST